MPLICASFDLNHSNTGHMAAIWNAVQQAGLLDMAFEGNPQQMPSWTEVTTLLRLRIPEVFPQYQNGHALPWSSPQRSPAYCEPLGLDPYIMDYNQELLLNISIFPAEQGLVDEGLLFANLLNMVLTTAKNEFI
jgi:hypothetical protein